MLKIKTEPEAAPMPKVQFVAFKTPLLAAKSKPELPVFPEKLHENMVTLADVPLTPIAPPKIPLLFVKSQFVILTVPAVTYTAPPYPPAGNIGS